jgi:hypothetical protein
MITTYFYGCWWLPVMLTLLDFDAVKLGKPVSTSEVCLVAAGGSEEAKDKGVGEGVEDEKVVVA